MSNKNFDSWNESKKKLNQKMTNRSFHEKEVWFVKVGVNIGYEQDGSPETYMRPVLIFKKFSKNVFIGIPLSKTKKSGRFYHQFTLKGIKSVAILSQVRLFDAKRLQYLHAKLPDNIYDNIKQKLIALLQ